MTGRPRFRRQAGGRALADWCVIGCGLGAAATSTAFAFAMVMDGDRAPTFPGAEHLALFAMPASRPRALETIAAPAIDRTPTGTIRPSPAPQAPALGGWSTHGLVAGRALVLGPDGFVLVGPGDALGAAGDVVRVAVVEGGVSVATTRGTIGPLR